MSTISIDFKKNFTQINNSKVKVQSWVQSVKKDSQFLLTVSSELKWQFYSQPENQQKRVFPEKSEFYF